jgi:hypothetical protein
MEIRRDLRAGQRFVAALARCTAVAYVGRLNRQRACDAFAYEGAEAAVDRIA